MLNIIYQIANAILSVLRVIMDIICSYSLYMLITMSSFTLCWWTIGKISCAYVAMMIISGIFEGLKLPLNRITGFKNDTLMINILNNIWSTFMISHQCAFLLINFEFIVASLYQSLMWTSIYLFGAYILADLITGIVHFVGDYFKLRFFIEHHKNPGSIMDYGYFFTTFESYMIAYAVLLLTNWLRSPLLNLTHQIVVHGGFLHKYAHLPKHDLPKIVHILQSSHIIVPRSHHLKHHSAPYAINHPTLSGWTSIILNPITKRIMVE